MSAIHRKTPQHDSFETIRTPDWRSTASEVVLSSLTYTSALSNFEKLSSGEGLIEIFGIDDDKPPQLLKTNQRGKRK